MNKNQPPRKPLRQRVADRKRGIKEVRPISERKARYLRFLKLFLTTAQYLGLVMLVLSLSDIVRNDYEVRNWELIFAYCSMFIIGRAGITIMSSMGTFR